MSTMFKSGGVARFLAMLLTLVIFSGLCVAAPSPSSDIVTDKQLEARGPASEIDFLVRTGETKYFKLQKGEKYGAVGFSNSIGVLFLGKNGAIIGQYANTPFALTDSDPTIQGQSVNPKALIHALPAAIREHPLGDSAKIKTYLFYPEGMNGDLLHNIIAVITLHMNLPRPNEVEYTVSPNNKGFYVGVKQFSTKVKFDATGSGKFTKVD